MEVEVEVDREKRGRWQMRRDPLILLWGFASQYQYGWLQTAWHHRSITRSTTIWNSTTFSHVTGISEINPNDFHDPSTLALSHRGAQTPTAKYKRHGSQGQGPAHSQIWGGASTRQTDPMGTSQGADKGIPSWG